MKLKKLEEIEWSEPNSDKTYEMINRTFIRNPAKGQPEVNKVFLQESQAAETLNLGS
ncbi:hypothetical protein QCA50_016329 [Cerrena zonata]|uniref:Uncharacterized protein n=1 Tax=Cerrena zonata TaxID=2478898 RepID=A0AAW0FHI4_9APHY